MAWNRGAHGGDEATGPGLQPWGVGRSEVGEMEPDGETNLSEVTLTF